VEDNVIAFLYYLFVNKETVHIGMPDKMKRIINDFYKN